MRLWLLAACAALSALAGVRAAAPGGAPRPVVVGILVGDGVRAAEVSVPFDLLQAAARHAQPGMQVLLIARGPEPVTSDAGLRFLPDGTFAGAPEIDVLIVPGARQAEEDGAAGREIAAFLRERAPRARFLVGLGSGAFALARAGLLDGRACVTAPDAAPELRRQCAGARVLDGVSLALDGPLVTCGGGARSHEAALYLIERCFGELPAIAVGREFGIDWCLERARCHDASARGTRGYDVGDSIDPEVTVEDAQGGRRRLLDLASARDRVIVLFLFGGGEHEAKLRRGGLWCDDSMNEMPLLRHAQARFADEPVAFVPVACPPIFDEEKCGFPKGAFRPASAHLAEARELFVRSTEAAAASGVIPFPQVYYDPAFKLARDVVESPPRDEEPWVGRFRARGEYQEYGLPALWILSRDGRVLVPPLRGNAYEKNAVLHYGDRELEEAIRTALELTAK